LIRSSTGIDPAHRRAFIILFDWRVAARAQRSAMPVIGFLHSGSSDLQG
jgi:hypothetical protein